MSLVWFNCACSQLCSEVICVNREAHKPCDSLFIGDLLCINDMGGQKKASNDPVSCSTSGLRQPEMGNISDTCI